MNIGMLWYDSNPGKSVGERVEIAADYYRKKYGRSPNLCFVHPSALAEPTVANGASPTSLRVEPMDTVLPNHFWLGIKTKAEGSQQAVANLG